MTKAAPHKIVEAACDSLFIGFSVCLALPFVAIVASPFIPGL